MMLRRLIGEHIELDTEPGVGLGAIKADPGQMHQVLLNLVVNGRDAMLDGGKLTIADSEAVVHEGESTLHPGVDPGTYVTLTVTDTGVGMDEATRTKLFEPFFTTKEPGKGTGLGLSTVYGIVRQSGGHIAVESEPGEGSTFTIYLPRIGAMQAPQPELPVREEVPAEASDGQGSEKILLVEDDPSVRELAREILEMNGYAVLEAENGIEALKIFESEPDAIELMVTDLVMPKMGGRDLANHISPRRPDLRVLYLSGYTDSVAIQQGMLDSGSFFPAEALHALGPRTQGPRSSRRLAPASQRPRMARPCPRAFCC